MMAKRILSVTLALVLVFSMAGCGKENAEKAESTASQKTTQTEKAINYSMEDGKAVITDADKNDIMNSFEYAKTDGYISNELLRDYMGDDTVASFANLATTYVDIIYDVNSVSVQKDRNAYVELLSRIVSNNCVVGETANDTFIEKWTDAVIDSGAVLTASFSTSKDYVYADDTEIYVRGILNMKVEAAKDVSKLNGLLPVEIEVGKEYNFVYDIGFLALSHDYEVETKDNGKIDYILALATF